MLKHNKPDMRGKVRHLKTVADLTCDEIMEILSLGQKLKMSPQKYSKILDGKTMLMLFEKPSLRTRVSFETGMTQLGGHAIYYSIAESPMGKGETIHDTAQCLTEYVDIVMARVKQRATLYNLCKDAGIPVLNGLDDFGHPCQVLSDMFTILEQKGTFKGTIVTYLGDIDNNVTYDLMRAVTILGGNMRVGGPEGHPFICDPEVVKLCEGFAQKSGGSIKVFHDPKEAVKDADVIYTDSWMSYHIDPKEQEERKNRLLPFKVTQELLNLAKKNVTFMNCLPANREMEQTSEVIDGPRSIVFTQAGNRLHVQKAIILFFLGMAPKELSANKVLVALGGNALIQPGQKGTHTEQFINSETACKQLAQLVKRGYKLVVTHGNGPQVGHIYQQNEFAKEKIPQQPLFCNGSQSQGFIGFMMQNKLQMAMMQENVNMTCACVISQSVVDKNDPAFQNPTKPIGKFYSEEEAKELRKQGYTVKEDSGRGWRIVVASPQPKKIVEIDAIKALVEHNVIPICCGGGGIPVIEENGEIIGIDSVIDKDLCAEVLAGAVGVDMFMILTDVDGVYMNYRKENQTFIHQMTASEARKGLDDKQFGEGSMLPKVLAACKFVEKTGKTAIITSLSQCVAALDGKAGTRIILQ